MNMLILIVLFRNRVSNFWELPQMCFMCDFVLLPLACRLPVSLSRSRLVPPPFDGFVLSESRQPWSSARDGGYRASKAAESCSAPGSLWSESLSKQGGFCQQSGTGQPVQDECFYGPLHVCMCRESFTSPQGINVFIIRDSLQACMCNIQYFITMISQHCRWQVLVYRQKKLTYQTVLHAYSCRWITMNNTQIELDVTKLTSNTDRHYYYDTNYLRYDTANLNIHMMDVQRTFCPCNCGLHKIQSISCGLIDLKYTAVFCN